MWIFATILFSVMLFFQIRLYQKLDSPNPQPQVITKRVPVFNVPTQHVDSYRQIGILHSSGSVLPLLGRRVHNGSTNWHYYTLTNDAMSLRIPLKHKNRMCTDTNGCQELYNGDTVSIPELGASFTIKMYDESPYIYNPRHI
jgi:hypothetical protein